jgi:OOP family OmpA-OmpF porin
LRAGPVETDLAAKANALLAGPHPWAKIAFDGRDGAISGMAPNEKAIADAAAMAMQARSVRTVDTAAVTLPPVADPWTFSASRSGDAIVLSGNYSDEATREQLKAAAAAAVPGAKIEDRMTIARGAGEGAGALSAYLLAQLAAMEGTIGQRGADVTAKGRALSVRGYESLIDALSARLPGGGRIASAEIEPATVAPYGLSVEKDGAKVTLAGFVPSATMRGSVIGAAKAAMPLASIEDTLKIALGAPPGIDWQKAAEFLVGQAANLAKGKAALEGGNVSIDGQALDPDKFDAAGKTLGGDLPAGLKLAAANIREPAIDPYVWSLKAGADSVELSGFAPDRKLAAENVERVRSAFPGAVKVIDKQRLAAGAHPDIAAAYSVAIQLASRLSGAVAEMSGPNLRVAGEALTGVAANEIRARAANGLPPGFRGVADIALAAEAALVAPDDCQKLIADVMAGATIRFATGKAAIDADSLGLLDRLAHTVRRCPDARVEISGHTDSEGADDANLALSVERAEAVRDYLVRGGVLFSRLDAAGYGETRPVADNATAEGRAKNRRIDLNVIK